MKRIFRPLAFIFVLRIIYALIGQAARAKRLVHSLVVGCAAPGRM